VVEEESKVLQDLEQKKKAYQISYVALRDLKGEIECIQRVDEVHRTGLQATFDSWFASVKKVAYTGTESRKTIRGQSTADGKG